MHKIILAGPQSIAKPFDTKGIFDFLQPHYIYPIPLADICQHAGDILHLPVVPRIAPSPLPFRRPLIIVFLDERNGIHADGVVFGVEEVFDIIADDA